MRFSPGIYEHAAALIGHRPWAVSRSADLLAMAHQAAWERYHHPIVVVGIDVYNLEPEAYGAFIAEPRGTGIPAISAHPCAEISGLTRLPPLVPLQHPRIRAVLEAGQALLAHCPSAQVRIPVCGPFALAIGLLGLDELLMALVEDRAELVEALDHLHWGQVTYLHAIRDAGLRPIFFESGTTPPLLPAKAFREVEAPLLSRLFAESRELFKEAPACIIGGDAAPIAEPLFEAGPGFVIAPSETDQATFMQVASRYPDIHVRVNMPASGLLSKDFAPVRAAAESALALARSRDNTSVGCGVVPYEADPGLVCRLRDFVEGG